MAAITNASVQNRVCCVALRCHEPATVVVRVVVDSATRRAQSTGEPVPIEVALDYCAFHNPDPSDA
jgi:hypothetical protein